MIPVVRNRYFVPAILSLLGFSVQLHAAGIEVGRGRIETTLGVRTDYDSNIFLNNTQQDDMTATANAAARYVHDVGLISAEATLNVSAVKFFDNTDEDSVDPSLTGQATYTPSDKTTLTGSAAYSRQTVANEAVNGRTKSDNLVLSGSLQNLFSEKLGYRVSGGFDGGSYLTTGYADVMSYNAGVSAVYVYSPKLTTTTGFNYRESWTDNRVAGSGDPSNKDYRYTIGFEGELAPKLSGTLDLGVVKNSFNSSQFDSSSAMFAGAGLKWVAAQKTTVSLNGSHDFGLTAANQSSKVGSVSLGVTHVLNPKWTLDGGLSYSHAGYQGLNKDFDRKDDIVRLRGRVSYALASNVNVDLSAGYADAQSSSADANVEAYATYHRVNVGVGITATF
jgi:polysaccharide biosynthesis protein VpsM